ncbi:MAG TPA: SRPBCC family protein [Asanoa sp.]|nr:SRPBCC family protein [Asanoa sp.]
MPKTGTFTYALRPKCAAADAVALLSNFSRHTELHPFIVKVTELPPVDGAVRSFVINDRFKLGPVGFTTTYTADVMRVTDDEVVTVARQRPGTTLHNHTRLHPEPDGTVRIEVTITLTAPTPLFGYAFKQAQTAHHALAERLKNVLES